jgi:hypothetical protein
MTGAKLPTEFRDPPPPPEVLPEAFLCRVSNPSQRAHVLYSGAKSDVVVRVAPGETVEIVLIDPLIDTLMDQENADPEEPGLKVIELGPPPPPPAPVERPSRRRPRPAKAAA